MASVKRAQAKFARKRVVDALWTSNCLNSYHQATAPPLAFFHVSPMPEHTPFALPTPSGVTEPSHDLTDTQLAMLQAVKDHFLADGYTLPGEEKGELTELEKFWLVSLAPYPGLSDSELTRSNSYFESRTNACFGEAFLVSSSMYSLR